MEKSNGNQNDNQAGSPDDSGLSGLKSTKDSSAGTNTASTENRGVPHTPEQVIFKRIENQSGEMVAECELYSGGDYKYIAILIENSPLPTGIGVDDRGSISVPRGLMIPVVINANCQRQKVFKGLNSGSTYYMYYVVLNDKGASGISAGKAMLCV